MNYSQRITYLLTGTLLGAVLVTASFLAAVPR